MTLLKRACLLLFASSALACGASLTFTETWHVDVPPLALPSKVAICPNGTAIAVAADGTLLRIRQSGIVVTAKLATTTIDAVACAKEGTVYATAPGMLFVSSGHDAIRLQFNQFPLPLEEVTSLSPSLIGSGRLFALGSPNTKRQTLHLLSDRGNLIRSMGESMMFGNTGGKLVWDDSHSRLLFLPRFLPEVQIYDEEGSQLGVKALNSTFHPISTGARNMGPELLGAAVLPGGVLMQRSLSGNDPYLELFDSSFRSLLVAPSSHAQLCGADAQGNIYFAFHRRIVCVRPENGTLPKKNFKKPNVRVASSHVAE